LIVGGAFTVANGHPAQALAAWDGSDWRSLGNLGPTVMSLTVHQGRLIAAGSFESAGGTTAHHIAAYDGVSWQPLGAGLTFAGSGGYGSVKIVSYNDQLFAATTTGVQVWDGAAWQPLGAMTSSVFSLTSYNGSLVAVLSNGGVLRRWDGAVWQPMTGPGVYPNWVNSAAAFNDELVVAGYFDHADTVPAACVARWSDTRQPWIVTQPQAAALPSPGSALVLSVVPASGYDPLSLRWRKNATPLPDGPTGTGSVVSGAATASLTIAGITPEDAGTYDIVIANTCGSTASAPAAVSVCYANCDNSSAPPVLNVNDFGCFINRFATGDPYANCDGSTTPPTLSVQDFACFLNAFAAGCP
jgi:hypothetical protein